MDDINEIGRNILHMRTQEGGYKRVTDETITNMINDAYKAKQIKKMKKTKEPKAIKQLHSKTIKKYIKIITEKFNIIYFSKSHVKKEDRILMENDDRSSLSNLAMLANICKIPQTNPLYTKLRHTELPLVLLFNIDSTSFKVDVDLHDRDKGTYDEKSSRNHIVSTPNDRLPFNIRITILCNGIGKKKVIIAIKCDKKFINNQLIQKVENPVDKDIIIYLVSGEYGYEYFTEQVSTLGSN